MATNKTLTKRKLIKFLNDNLEDTVGTDFDSAIVVMSGKAGLEYSRYSGGGRWFISFEGSILSYIMNAYWEHKSWEEFFNRFSKFLTDHGTYHELGESWNMSIY
tara:strand:+ start:907 stop:1218 length:312 start_codon:yes stop_codon:yes gene_type:complete